jgi:hypothetical protein
MTVSQNALSKVHDLYVMQIELWKHLREGNFQNANQRKETQKCLRQFSKLLNQVDWHYMGGEDVLESLHFMRGEVSARLRNIRRRKLTIKRATVKRVVVTKKTKARRK